MGYVYCFGLVLLLDDVNLMIRKSLPVIRELISDSRGHENVNDGAEQEDSSDIARQFP